MAEKVMNNVREKLSKSRELCPGMSEDVYALTDYLSTIANDSLVPQGMVLMLALALNDIQNGKNSSISEELPKKLIERKVQVLAQAVYFPQVIDKIAADEEFSKEFRLVCKEVLEFDPPKRVTETSKEDFPDYISVAVDWWANAIVSPNFSNGMLPVYMFVSFVNSIKKFSKKEINRFKKTLAKEIAKSLKVRKICELSVDCHPCLSLAVAGNKIGVSPFLGYPLKTTMRISETKVEVSIGDGAEYKTLWKK